jgi:hypothetical protein
MTITRMIAENVSSLANQTEIYMGGSALNAQLPIYELNVCQAAPVILSLCLLLSSTYKQLRWLSQSKSHDFSIALYTCFHLQLFWLLTSPTMPVIQPQLDDGVRANEQLALIWQLHRSSDQCEFVSVHLAMCFLISRYVHWNHTQGSARMMISSVA